MYWRLTSTKWRLSPWEAAALTEHGWIQELKLHHQQHLCLFFFFNLSALPSSGLALLPGKLSPQRSMGNSRPLLRVPGPEDFPSSSKQSPRPESHWSRLGHVPILEPITVASGICKMNGLLVGHTSTQTTWMWEKHHFPKENWGAVMTREGVDTWQSKLRCPAQKLYRNPKEEPRKRFRALQRERQQNRTGITLPDSGLSSSLGSPEHAPISGFLMSII